MLVFFLLSACDNLGFRAAKMIPALEQIDPSWADDPVDCEATHAPPDATFGVCTKKSSCNTVLEDTTIGGESHFGDDFY